MDVKHWQQNVTEQIFDKSGAPTYRSPLLDLIQGKPASAPAVIDLPEASPELANRVAQMEARQAQAVAGARVRAYAHRPDLAPLGLADAELMAEWEAWHVQYADTWRPDGGELDVTNLLCIGPADLLPVEPVDRYADTWEVCP